ncbi:MAG: hypothetical protein RLZZ381_265 [Cyanobacteriota bacterium]
MFPANLYFNVEEKKDKKLGVLSAKQHPQCQPYRTVKQYLNQIVDFEKVS